MCNVINPILRALYGLFTKATPLSLSAYKVTIKEDCTPFILSNEQLGTIMDDMDKAIKNGLGKETNPSSIVKCFVTYIQDLPNGTERGKFLALDLGGTNFRILFIELGENEYFHMDSEIFKVPSHIQTGKGTELFDHIAKCLAEFVKKHNLDNKKALPLGFTFSFPLRQIGLTKGYLESWTKGFNCSGVVNEDVVKLLKDAIKRRNDIEIDVCGILNDTTGTIMSCAWKNPNTKIGLIVGTGCNACYVEKVENAELFIGDKSKPHVIVNTEWGAFGDDGIIDSIRTIYDRKLDENSLNPGHQRFEKMISGMYMGEIVRMVIVDLTNQKKLFDGRLSEQMKTPGTFDTSFVSDIESDETNYKETLKVLNEMGIVKPSFVDCANVQFICECVSKRSAHLVSAGLATLLNKMSEKTVTIGVDGSVYRFHPYFHKIMVEKIKQLVNPEIKFDLMLSEDGSGRGAALVAAVAIRDEQYNRQPLDS
ncbi:Hexokinase, N-terminal,Hexokinase, binding site,Hexokinase,Hexokinase, C-terminal [Cinara cedri]|uniref:Phosphotransferase n=1 Tax=Cinara cedri TaxID=506608 RepID=A0A5E4MZ37_9HEMI|nr:Hexokinase, N-terminal,Hexokinase, binding site,Hexokinase,Hexokinase, C-terminal [Cinara cedri]